MSGSFSLVLFAVLAGGGDVTLVEFSDAGCPSCRAMAPLVRRLATEGHAIRQVDVKRQPEVAQQYGIIATPTYVLFVDGRETQRYAGMTTYDGLVQLISRGEKPAGLGSEGTRLAGGRPLVRGQSPETAQPVSTTGPEAAPPAAPEQIALAATVRLKVEENEGYIGVGTGTIIDTHLDEQSQQYEALVLTCGHLFKKRPENGKIDVELFAPGVSGPVRGELLDYDEHTDVALVSIWPGIKVTPVPVAPAGYVTRPQDQVFTVGCSKGQDPTVEASKIHAVNKYVGRPNYTVGGAPADGRSGGGLFNAEGALIGVCNAADPQDQEGVYAGLAAVHSQLDEFNLQAVYQGTAIASNQPRATDVAESAAPRGNASLASFEAPAEPAAPLPENRAAPATYAAGPAAAPTNSQATNAAISGASTELVCIFRQLGDSQGQSEVLVVDGASAELIQRIVEEARATGQARLAARQQKQASLEPERTTRRPLDRRQPVVRGQSAE